MSIVTPTSQQHFLLCYNRGYTGWMCLRIGRSVTLERARIYLLCRANYPQEYNGEVGDYNSRVGDRLHNFLRCYYVLLQRLSSDTLFVPALLTARCSVTLTRSTKKSATMKKMPWREKEREHEEKQ
eukprot:scaffold10013_cov94-Skeletonema_marinoi.AAC.2